MAPKPLPLIDSTAWEHPADRAALNAMRAIPGFDTVVKQVAGFFGETGVRQLFLANAVRVGPTQRPKLDALYTEVLTTLDWPTRPQLYVTQTPLVNAAAYGFKDPFIVLNSAAIELLDREEQRGILAHELGHIMSGHVTYSTIAIIVMTIGLRSLPFLAGLALLPFELALMEWYRKAELSADRAGLPRPGWLQNSFNLVDRNMEAGTYRVPMGTQGRGRGVYFLSMSAGAFRQTQKVFLP